MCSKPNVSINTFGQHVLHIYTINTLVGAHLASLCRLLCHTHVEVVLLPAVQVVYLPSCVTRMMGPSRGDPESEPVHDKLLSLFGKANYEVIYPEVCG